MKIPLVDLKSQYISIKPEIDEAIQKILDNTSFIMGSPVEDFEKNLAEFCNCQKAIGTSSGTSALFLALKAYGIKKGDEVITVPNSFIATAEAIVHCGATPVFVDINEKTMLIDVSKINEKITSRTKAIIPVHLYGQICDMDPLMEIAKENGLAVIEDAAQAIGATYKGRTIPISETATFSFFPAKNLGAYGDAGGVVTNNSEIADKIFKLRNHGRVRKYESDSIGYGARLDALQAAVLNVKLNHLSGWLQKRRDNAAKYSQSLQDVEGVRITHEEDYGEKTYYMYVIRTNRRNELFEKLKEKEIACGIHYPVPLHLQTALSFLGYQVGDFPVTEKASREILSIPMFPELSSEQIEKVSSSIKEVMKNDS